MNLGKKREHTPPFFNSQTLQRKHTSGFFFFLKNVSLPPPPHALFQRSSHSLSYSKSLRRKEPLQLILVYPDYSFHKSRVLVYWLFLWQGEQEAGRVRDATFPATPFRTQVLAQTSLRRSGVPFIRFWVSLASQFPTHIPLSAPSPPLEPNSTRVSPPNPTPPPERHQPSTPAPAQKGTRSRCPQNGCPSQHVTPGCRSPEARPPHPLPRRYPCTPVSVGPAPLRVSHSPLPRSHP